MEFMFVKFRLESSFLLLFNEKFHVLFSVVRELTENFIVPRETSSYLVIIDNGV